MSDNIVFKGKIYGDTLINKQAIIAKEGLTTVLNDDGLSDDVKEYFQRESDTYIYVLNEGTESDIVQIAGGGRIKFGNQLKNSMIICQGIKMITGNKNFAGARVKPTDLYTNFSLDFGFTKAPMIQTDETDTDENSEHYGEQIQTPLTMPLIKDYNMIVQRVTYGSDNNLGTIGICFAASDSDTKNTNGTEKVLLVSNGIDTTDNATKKYTGPLVIHKQSDNINSTVYQTSPEYYGDQSNEILSLLGWIDHSSLNYTYKEGIPINLNSSEEKLDKSLQISDIPDYLGILWHVTNTVYNRNGNNSVYTYNGNSAYTQTKYTNGYVLAVPYLTGIYRRTVNSIPIYISDSSASIEFTDTRRTAYSTYFYKVVYQNDNGNDITKYYSYTQDIGWFEVDPQLDFVTSVGTESSYISRYYYGGEIDLTKSDILNNNDIDKPYNKAGAITIDEVRQIFFPNNPVITNLSSLSRGEPYIELIANSSSKCYYFYTQIYVGPTGYETHYKKCAAYIEKENEINYMYLQNISIPISACTMNNSYLFPLCIPFKNENEAKFALGIVEDLEYISQSEYNSRNNG